MPEQEQGARGNRGQVHKELEVAEAAERVAQDAAQPLSQDVRCQAGADNLHGEEHVPDQDVHNRLRPSIIFEDGRPREKVAGAFEEQHSASADKNRPLWVLPLSENV